MPKPLNATQLKVWRAIADHLAEQGIPPTIREIQARCGIHSMSSVTYSLDRLESAGLITRDKHLSRTIRLVETPVLPEAEEAA